MKLAIITGVSRGLGKALLMRAMGQFDVVVMMGRSLPPGVSPGPKLFFVAVDFAAFDPAALNVLEQFPAVDAVYFFDNAAVLDLGRSDDDAFVLRLDRALAVNVRAPAVIGHHLLARRQAAAFDLVVVHMTTGATRRAIAGWSSYCASKAAAAMLWDVVAKEHPDVRIFKIDPGAMDSDMQALIRTGVGMAPDDHRYFADLPEKKLLKTPERAAQEIFYQLGLS